MESTKYKRKQEERRLRSLARIVLAACVSIACIMLGAISIKLFSSGILFKGVENVSAEVEKVKVHIPDLTGEMTQSLLDAGFNLFQSSIQKEENSLLAPYTTLTALGMLENGAASETLDEIQSFLGGYSLSEINSAFAALNKKFSGYTSLTCTSKNSIWLKRFETLIPKDYFLKVNATYYGADLFVADFSKDNTVNKINEWLKEATMGNVVSPIKSIEDATSIYLLSSLNFKADWLKPYESSDVLGGEFKLTNGEKQSVKYLYSKENYLEGDKAEGFIKSYVDNKCSFVAIRPTDGTSIYDYVKSLDSESFKKVIHSKSTQKAIVAFPKFTYESDVDLSMSLKALGIETPFDEENADFSKVFDEEKKLYLSQVLQRNYIQIDEKGTSSAATNTSQVNAVTAIEEGTEKSIIFNSPFLYAVIDNETKLPLLIGIVEKPIA